MPWICVDGFRAEEATAALEAGTSRGTNHAYFFFSFYSHSLGQEPSAHKEKPPPNPQPASYAGSDSCKDCHAELYDGWAKSPHWKTTLNAKEGPSKQGCEGCHGAAASHIADPSDTFQSFSFLRTLPRRISMPAVSRAMRPTKNICKPSIPYTQRATSPASHVIRPTMPRKRSFSW